MLRSARVLRSSLAVVALCVWIGAGEAQAGGDLLAAIERAPASVVGEITAVTKLDTHGYRGALRVEQALVGVPASDAERTLGWEELAPSRPPRFKVGDRVLVALEPLSGASIWLSRVPDVATRVRMLGIADRGSAFLHDPAPGSVTLLSHFLALAPELRDGPTGVGHLAQLAARGEAPLALGAVARMGEIEALNEQIEPAAAHALVASLMRTDEPQGLATAVVALIAERKLEALRPPLEARVASALLPPPSVLGAFAALDGGLPTGPQRSWHDADAPEEHRRVAARWARGDGATEYLTRVARDDPDPRVRGLAVARLVELDGEGAISTASMGLYDPEPTVRATTAESLGRLGAVAVPELRDAVERGRPEAAVAAVAGLMLTDSAEGTAALVDTAANHPDAGVRKLARVALGEEIGDTH